MLPSDFKVMHYCSYTGALLHLQMTDTQLPTILFATSNPGKIAELRSLFRIVPATFEDLTDIQHIAEVAETGLTLGENAALKATGYAKQTGLWSLADDSGLEIEALDGRPGVFSARYGGEGLGFPERMQIILNELKNTADQNRNARFVCVIALADDTEKILFSAEGECRGRIASEPRGTGGFGYDPIFVPAGYDRTFGELPDAVKSRISHRARAAEKIMRYLLDFIGIPT